MAKVQQVLPSVELCSDPYDALDGADAAAIVTEWDEFKRLDLSRVKQRMRRTLIVDGRNILDPEEMSSLGIEYCGIGR
jgi:UDPglucose 6-dehydrogenase